MFPIIRKCIWSMSGTRMRYRAPAAFQRVSIFLVSVFDEFTFSLFKEILMKPIIGGRMETSLRITFLLIFANVICEFLYLCFGLSGFISPLVPELEAALKMPETGFKETYKRDKPMKESMLIFSCLKGGRAQRATKLALAEGFQK